jgi:hypothetical protein
MNITRAIRRLFGRESKRLNCWPGAVCHVVDDGTVTGKFLGGKTITVTTLHTNLEGKPAWCYEGLQFLILLGPEMVLVEWIPDAILRPITPPPGSVTESEVRALYSGRELVDIVKERL